MSMGGIRGAVSAVLSKYARVSGRARRPEFWYWVLAVWLAGIALALFEQAVGINRPDGGGPLSGLFALAILLPNICVGARRLHDTGKSAWWLLIGLVPLVGFIVLIVFFAQKSDKGENAYGPEPPAPASA